MASKTASAVLAVALFAAQQIRASPPNVIQNPRIVQVLWNGPGQRTASPNTDFLSKFIATVNWMKADWGVNVGFLVHGPGSGGAWPITPVDASTNARSRSSAGCSGSSWTQSTSTGLCDADIVAELEYQLQHGTLPVDLSTCDSQSPPNCNINFMYVVQLPVGVTERTFNSSAGMAGPFLCDPVDANGTFCGYHDKFQTVIGTSTLVVRYVVVRDFADPDCLHHATSIAVNCTSDADCTGERVQVVRCDKTALFTPSCPAESPRRCSWNVQQGSASDNATILLSHEVGETLTDPELQSNDREIGDKCSDPALAPYGKLGGTPYTIQQLGGHGGVLPGCYLQCSDTAPLCSMQAYPERVVEIVNTILN